MPWFAVRCLFHDQSPAASEERITLWQVGGGESAIDLAEIEAAYCARRSGMTVLAFAQACEMVDDVTSGAEIVSLFGAALSTPTRISIDSLIPGTNVRSEWERACLEGPAVRG